MRHLLWIAAAAALIAGQPEPAAAAPRGKTGAAARKKAAARPAKPVAPQAEKAAEEPKPTEGQALRRGERVEFDARLIQGQTAKAGAVYLFERAGGDLSSMVDQRKSYRREIVEEVFPQENDL